MKKKTILFLVLMLLFLALLTNGLYGEEKVEILCFITGNKYLDLDEAYKPFYVVGLVDMFLEQIYYSDPELYFIVTEDTRDMTVEQTKAIFDKYLEKHPEIWHYTAAGILEMAMMELVGEKK